MTRINQNVDQRLQIFENGLCRIELLTHTGIHLVLDLGHEHGNQLTNQGQRPQERRKDGVDREA